MNIGTKPVEESADDSDLIAFADEEQDDGSAAAIDPWLVLLVDDDRDVHDATLLALKEMRVEGRSLKFLHAYSSYEARELVQTHADIAVILLDVVMESDDAGLRLVQIIRNELDRTQVQIILRTGQPGFAPEIETIQKYQINDYRTKTELTQVRLYTSLTGAIRTYRHLLAMEETRRGMEVIVHGSTELMQVKSLYEFSLGLIHHLCAMLGVASDGVVCSRFGDRPGDGARVIAASGQYAPLTGTRLSQLPDGAMRHDLELSLKHRANVIDSTTTLCIASDEGQALCVFVNVQPLRETDRHLIQTFCSSYLVGLENLLLHQKMRNLAYLDQLLGIANRNQFLDLVQDQLHAPQGLTVAVIDLDDFAGENAMFGHEFGDEMLKAFCARLSSTFESQVALARLSGDTFALLGRGELVNPESLNQLTSTVLQVQNQMVTVSATCGLVRLEVGGGEGADILKHAHVALKIAKIQHRGGSMYYSAAMGTDATERSMLLRRLREAFDSHRLFVVYQPQVRLSDRATIGAEALLRWRTDDGQFVPPDRFIPVAEQSGLMISIGEFVLRSACHHLKHLNTLGFTGFRMSVNVSQAQFRDTGFVSTVTRALHDVGVAASDLELEITESMAAEDLSFVLGVLNELKQLGVTVAIDDFGTGYSSLSVLGQLQLDRLKIDKSFVDKLAVSEGVAKSIIDIGKCLDLQLIAEGVETEAQAQTLINLGCQEGQGYLYSRPLSAQDLERWLVERTPGN